MQSSMSNTELPRALASSILYATSEHAVPVLCEQGELLIEVYQFSAHQRGHQGLQIPRPYKNFSPHEAE